MKKFVKASKFKNVNSIEFVSKLVSCIKEEGYHAIDSSNSLGYEIQVEDVDSLPVLMDVVSYALSDMMGYDVYDITNVDDEGYNYAAVKGEAFVKLIVDIGDYFNNGVQGYIDMKFDNGNVLFQDWYED